MSGAGVTVTPGMKSGGKGAGAKGGGGKSTGTVGLTGMSPAEFAKYVNAQVGSMYGPELGALKQYGTGMDNLFHSEMGDVNAGSGELAQMLAQIGPQVKQNFTDAANHDALFAGGAAAGLGADAPGVNPGVGSVLDTMYGQIPAKAQSDMGAGFESAADMLPQTALGMRNAAIEGIAGAQSKFDLSEGQKMATLLGEMGKAKQTVGNELQSQADRVYSEKLATQRMGLEAARFKYQMFNDNRRFGLSVQEFNQRANHEAAMLGLSTARFRQLVSHENATAARLNTAQGTRLYEEASKAATTMRYGKRGEEVIGANGQKHYVGTQPPMSYQQTVNALLKQFPALGLSGAVGVADSLYQPGQSGRPRDSGVQNSYFGTDGAGKNYSYTVPPGMSPQARKQVSGILTLAHQYIGTPYVWGGESTKGFDCSGFAQYLYGKVGVSIPRDTYSQWQDGRGIPIPKGHLQPGDLVFYRGSDPKIVNGQVLPGHVAVYVGNGMIIDAYGAGYGVIIQGVNAIGGYMGARRFINDPAENAHGLDVPGPHNQPNKPRRH